MSSIILNPFSNINQNCMVELLINDKVKETYMLPDFALEAEAIKLFQRLKELSLSEDRFVRGIYLDDTLIGMVNDVSIEGNKIEVGYVIHPKYHNKGYGTEMLRMVIEQLFEKGYIEIIAGAFEDNLASRRIMEKCGMRLIDKDEDIEYRGIVHHCVYYSIAKW